MNSADYITSVSDFTAIKTKEIFGLKNNIEVIYNGIDIEVFQNSSEVIKPNTLLYFGSIIRKKGVLELANIFNLMVEKNPEVRLTLLGKDTVDVFENVSTLQLFKKRLSKKTLENVLHIKHVPYEEVNSYISKSSVVVLPSFAEAFPMTWLESMSMKKALVTSNIGWAKELMIDGETGYIVNPNNHDLYANRILELLKNDDLNLKMGLNARKRIESSFSQQKITQENIEYYKKIINE